MMMIFAAAMALFAAGPAADDHLGAPMPDGFVIANRQVAQSGAIEERIARGETLEDWSRMVTLLRVNADLPVDAYLGNFLKSVSNACPGARSSTPATATSGGYQALGGRLDCPLNPSTGKPETFFYRVFNHGGRLFMAQVAFRRVPSAADTAWAEAQLSGLKLCPASATDAVCAL